MTQVQDSKLAWFIFRALPCIGNQTRKRLIRRFKSPDIVFRAPADELKKIQGLKPDALDAILSFQRFKSQAQKRT